jgi:hypothetical protein
MMCYFSGLRLLQYCIAVPRKHCSSRSLGITRGYRLLHYCNEPYIHIFNRHCSKPKAFTDGAV